MLIDRMQNEELLSSIPAIAITLLEEQKKVHVQIEGVRDSEPEGEPTERAARREKANQRP